MDGLLVDSGPPNLAQDVRRLVRELGVRQCVTTHHHEDHSGNHGLLARELRITPLAHATAIPRLAQPDARPPLYRRVAWGERVPARVASLGDRLETPRFRFQVIHTPGHAADHVALFEPEHGWLFSGDLYLAPRLRYLRADEDVYAMMDSLHRVLALEPRLLFCQHRGRVEDHAAAGQARFPGRAGRANPRAAPPRLERGRDRAGTAVERSVLAGVDRRRFLEAEFRAGVPAPLAAVEIRPGRRQHPLLRRSQRTLE